MLPLSARRLIYRLVDDVSSLHGVSLSGRGPRTCSPAHQTAEPEVRHELRHRWRRGEPGGDGGEDQAHKPGLRASAHARRPVGTSRRRQRGEPEAEVGEPGPGPVHREPHVGLQRLPGDRQQEQAEVSWRASLGRRPMSSAPTARDAGPFGFVFSGEPGFFCNCLPGSELTMYIYR